MPTSTFSHHMVSSSDEPAYNFVHYDQCRPIPKPADAY